jgi:predicted ATPase/DNA-binding SARP family transcriptional activator/predicted negative regulator of RcsB-dependent stress response
MSARLELHLLGKLKVVVNGRSHTDALPTKAQALLCYLAVTREAHSRHALAGLLWGDVPEDKAKNSLRVTLTALRKVCPDHLDVSHLTLSIVPESDLWLDTQALAAGLKNPANLPALQGALDLYRGDFLEDIHADGSPVFEEWLLHQRSYWQQQALQGLAHLSHELMARRDYDTAISIIQRRLAIEPWQEEAHRQLMLAQARLGHYNAALVQYETCRRLLAEELGVEPMAETTAVYERIKRARQERPYPLPADATPFIGRESELTRLHQMILQPACRLLTITGFGGMGKTRLALAAARLANRETAVEFLDGVVFISLADVADVDALPQTLAAALNLLLSGKTPPRTDLLNFLRHKEILLVLDNFEHLLDGADLLLQILNTCPHVKLLITSREPLQLVAEWRLDLAGLAFPQEGEPLTVIGEPSSDYRLPITDHRSPITDYPAVELFVQAARQVRPNFALNGDTPQVHELCQLVAGVPLAIKLAAAWLRAMLLEQIVAEVKQGLAILATQMRDVPPRQRSLQAVFDTTWAQLSAEEQRVFTAVSIFRGGFTAAAAQTITQATPYLLAGLIDRGLLQLDGTQYRLHELTRQYAIAKRDPTVAERLQTVHTQYYAQQLADLTPDLFGAKQKQAYAAIEQAIANIRLAWQQAVQALDIDSLLAMVEPVYGFYLKQGWVAEGSEMFASAVAALNGRRDEQSLLLMGLLQTRRGALNGRIGQFDEAEAALRQGTDIAQIVEEPRLITFALLELGSLQRDRSQFAEARRYFQESLNIAREMGDEATIAWAMERLGSAIWDMGSHTEAEALLQQALVLLRQQKNLGQIGRALNSLGNVLMSKGRNETAVAHFEEALTIFRELEDWLMLDTVLINLGMVTNALEDYAQSRRYYEESLGICRYIGDEVGVAYCLTGIGTAALAEKDWLGARRLIEQSLSVNRELGRERYVGINLNLLGDIEREEGKETAARQKFEESLAVFTRINHPWGIVTSHLRLGQLALVQERFEGAREHFITAVTQAHNADIEGSFHWALFYLATAQWRQEEIESALVILYFLHTNLPAANSLQAQVTELLAQTAVDLPQTSISTAQQKGQTITAVDLVNSLR